MDNEMLSSKVDHFHSKGFCVFDELFSSLDMDDLKATALENFQEVQEIIQSTNQEFGIGLKQGYDEIVQRQEGRYEVPYKMKNIFKNISESSELLEIIHAILGPEVVVANESLIISMPGTTDQAWHADGPHMSVTEHLPAHCLNVFIPLVDITLEEGPTEFRPASHYLTRDFKNMFLLAALKKELLPNQKPLMKKGSALLVSLITMVDLLI
jgi:ectoine hydroxylase-related dioxygenase (phytanoyl-CoA dioxygenase family)